MSDEFKPIESQEELDDIIQDVKQQFTDYEDLKIKNKELNTKLQSAQEQLESLQKGKDDYEKEIENLQSQVKGYEQDKLKSQIAYEYKIPRSLADRLVGEDEESLREDAKTMAETFNSQQTPPPLASTEPDEKDEDTPYQNLADELFIEGE